MIDRNAPTAKRLIISRVLLVVVAVLAAWTAGNAGADILFLVAWAFSIAAAGLFAALVMGVWYKKTTDAAACWGMGVGYAFTFIYLLWTEFAGLDFVELFGSKDAIVNAAKQTVGLAKVDPELKAYAQKIVDNAASVKDGALSWFGSLFFTTDTVVLRGRTVARLWTLNNISGGIIGVPLSFLTIYVVSQFTRAPSEAMMNFIDDIRVPRGGVRLVDQKEAVE
jgi:cation/acetate symporter